MSQIFDLVTESSVTRSPWRRSLGADGPPVPLAPAQTSSLVALGHSSRALQALVRNAYPLLMADHSAARAFDGPDSLPCLGWRKVAPTQSTLRADWQAQELTLIAWLRSAVALRLSLGNVGESWTLKSRLFSHLTSLRTLHLEVANLGQWEWLCAVMPGQLEELRLRAIGEGSISGHRYSREDKERLALLPALSLPVGLRRFALELLTYPDTSEFWSRFFCALPPTLEALQVFGDYETHDWHMGSPVGQDHPWALFTPATGLTELSLNTAGMQCEEVNALLRDQAALTHLALSLHFPLDLDRLFDGVAPGGMRHIALEDRFATDLGPPSNWAAPVWQRAEAATLRFFDWSRATNDALRDVTGTSLRGLTLHRICFEPGALSGLAAVLPCGLQQLALVDCWREEKGFDGAVAAFYADSGWLAACCVPLWQLRLLSPPTVGFPQRLQNKGIRARRGPCLPSRSVAETLHDLGPAPTSLRRIVWAADDVDPEGEAQIRAWAAAAGAHLSLRPRSPNDDRVEGLDFP